MSARVRFISCCLLILFRVAFGQQPKPASTIDDLRQRIADCLAQAKYEGALFGVKVVSLDTGATIFEQNAHKLFSPASVSKLYTMALALDRLGSDYRIKTSLYAASKPNHRGTLRGDLIVYGRGDPTINTRFHDGNLFKAFEPFVGALTNAGLKRVAGDIMADASFFRGPEFGSGWACDDLQYYYGAEISALTINDNRLLAIVKPGERPGDPCALALSPPTTFLSFSNLSQTAPVDARQTISFYRPLNENVIYASGKMPIGTNRFSDDVTVHNPAGMFAWFLKETLARRGITVSGRVRTVNWLDRGTTPLDCAKMVELGSVQSLPLRDIVREVLKISQNLYADLLLAHVGEVCRTPEDPADMTSEDLGIRELRKFLTQAGVSTNEVFFEEGSGLSRDNLTTPDATVALLKYMSRHKCADAYLDALPIAGVDGSIRNRMKNTPAAGNVRAKIGGLRWANTISGYVTTAAGEHLAFSLMLNRYEPPTGAHGRDDLDAIIVWLAGFIGRSG
jgi:D-alanyl-D-alanine carboxypeptidase/D-alanyl-D-alanine-endopeptidase (penicillin-binding protein 4)